jgi:molybdopterin-guanine dinucleotide biosynthesis protein A
MSRLGAIFAGGQARRFGTDKAAAAVDGVALIDRVAAALRPQCDHLIVVGREWPGLTSVHDAPRPGLGPLGALAGALRFAGVAGYGDVLTAGCDLPDLPGGLGPLLTPGPAVVMGQPLIGLWPAELERLLLDHLSGNADRSMRGWIAACGARQVQFGGTIANINTPSDLAAYIAGSSAGRSGRRKQD